MPHFSLDPAFERTSEALASLALCEARLQLDARYVWIVLIPRVAAAAELEDLGDGDRTLLLDEVVRAGRAVRICAASIGQPIDKLNVGQLGNITRQLHIHVVGRRRDDPAWPGPVWGSGAAEAYGSATLAIMRRALVEALTSPAVPGAGERS
jgi:diadenosine tetraphosphate (Ap4A) HIT family hydrolase